MTSLVYQQDGTRDFTPGHVQLFSVRVADGVQRQLTTSATDVIGDPAWALGSKSVLFASGKEEAVGRSYSSARIYRIASTGGPAEAISPVGLGARAPTVSPDGRMVAFLASTPNDHDYQQSDLWTMTINGRSVRRLAPALDREMTQPRFSSDGSAVYAGYGDAGENVLGRFPLRRTPTVVRRGLGDDGAFSVADDGAAAFATSDDDHPADVALLTRDRQVERITDLNATLLAGKQLAKVQPLTFRSTLDGAQVGGWLVMTPHAGATSARRPLVLSIHGGPHGFDEPAWDAEDQLLAAAGYAILHVNYRGSTSYGYAFADRIAADFLGPASEDLLSGVDAAVASGIADPNRLFVTGGSAGGELTAWIVGRTHRFKAAVALKPVIDAISESLTTVQYGGTRNVYGAFPWEDPLRFWRRSPLSVVGEVSTPTLVMVGEQDHNTPISEAQQIYAALKLRNVPTALVIVPDAGHDSVTGTPSRLVSYVAITLEWLSRYGEAAATPSTAQER